LPKYVDNGPLPGTIRGVAEVESTPGKRIVKTVSFVA
jgi:hypothetical protein